VFIKDTKLRERTVIGNHNGWCAVVRSSTIRIKHSTNVVRTIPGKPMSAKPLVRNIQFALPFTDPRELPKMSLPDLIGYGYTVWKSLPNRPSEKNNLL